MSTGLQRTVRRDPLRFRRAAVIIVATIIGVAAGLIWSGGQTGRYESDLRLLVGPIAGPRPTLDASGLLALTYAEALASNELVERASESIGEPLAVDDVAVIPNQQSRTVLVVVTSDDESVPQVAADTLATLMIDLAGQRVVPADPSQDAGLLTVLDPASPASRGPSHRGLGIALGAILGAAAGWGISRLWSSHRRSGRAAAATTVGRMGLPAIPVGHRGDGVATADPMDHAARQLHTAIGADDELVSFALLHDDPDLVDVIGELALSTMADRPVEIGDLDGRFAESTADHDVDAGEPTVVVHIAPVDETGDGVADHLAKLIDAPSAGASLWLVGTGLGRSALAALTAVVADAVVLVFREGSMSELDLDRAIDVLAALDRRPACVIAVARRADVAAMRLVRSRDGAIALGRSPA